MKLFGKNLDTEVAIIAEIGVNHEGSLAAAEKMLDLAAEAGADAVKFQTYSPDRYASASDPARLARVGGFSLSEENFRSLSERAKARGIYFFSTPLSEDVVPHLTEIADAIKIASGDLTFEPTVRATARSGHAVILSTGLGTLAEIDRAVGWLKDEIGAADLPQKVVLMQCISAYPTPIEEANVLSVPLLAERYGLPTGYSNHVIGPEACLAAVALGAQVLEVHFTDQKTGREFRDHEISFEPSDLAALVRSAPLIKAALGKREKIQMPSELPNLAAVRKGVVAARDLAAGAVLGGDDLMFARPATEFDSNDIGQVIGQTLKQPRKRGETILRADI
jgi:N,N'-diacetyllegionaminate synthase